MPRTLHRCTLDGFALARLLLLLPLIVGLGGCGAVLGVGTYANREKTLEHDAAYAGLRGRSVAVIVTAGDDVLYLQPRVPADLTRAITAQLAQLDPAARFADPDQTLDYLKANPYWLGAPVGHLIDHLAVERLLVVEVETFRTREPGASDVWMGTAIGRVKVHEAHSGSRNNPAFNAQVRVQFPEDRAVGLLQASDPAIAFGLTKTFSRDVVRLFHGYETLRKWHER